MQNTSLLVKTIECFKSYFQNLPNSSKYLEISLDLIEENETILINKFTCFNCKNFALNPTVCKICKIFYCAKCVNEFSKNKNEEKNHICIKCGNLRNLRNQGLEVSQLKEISQFQIKCLSRNKACQQLIKYNDYIIHLENCIFWKGISECRKCSKIYFANEIQDHLKFCEGDYIKCRICLRKILNENKSIIKDHEIQCQLEMKVEEELMKKSKLASKRFLLIF